jgi:hypothetical protein
MQEGVFALQRCLIEAARSDDKGEAVLHLRQADVELAMLRYKVRLSRDLKVMDFSGYEHASRLIDEVGRLLGGWKKRHGVGGAAAS